MQNGNENFRRQNVLFQKVFSYIHVFVVSDDRVRAAKCAVLNITHKYVGNVLLFTVPVLYKVTIAYLPF